MTKLAGVMGDPISHSLSPLMHGHWIKQLGIDATYLPYHVAPEDLGDALKALPKLGFSGVNLTIPHKEAAFTYMDEVSDIARQMGAINTVQVRADGTLYGTNTDGVGFIENLIYQLHIPGEDLGSKTPDNLSDFRGVNCLTPYLEHCLILGAGGAAKGVAVALKQAGAKRISISNRSQDKAAALAENVGANVIAWEQKETALEDVSLLVNTTSLGMKGQPPLELSLEALPKEALVSDIVYAPLVTPLLEAAKMRGNAMVTGIGMLIHQGIPGFEMWFGQRPKVDASIYQLLESKL